MLRGANPADRPVALDSIAAHLTGKAGGVVIDDFTVKAGEASGRITGTLGTAADDDGLTLRIVAADTEARMALRSGRSTWRPRPATTSWTTCAPAASTP